MLPAINFKTVSSFDFDPTECNNIGNITHFDFNISKLKEITIVSDQTYLLIYYKFINDTNERELLIYFDFYRHEMHYTLYYTHGKNPDIFELLKDVQQQGVDIDILSPLFREFHLRYIPFTTDYTNAQIIHDLSRCNIHLLHAYEFIAHNTHIFNYTTLLQYYMSLSGI